MKQNWTKNAKHSNNNNVNVSRKIWFSIDDFDRCIFLIGIVLEMKLYKIPITYDNDMC